jgi:hypothetical protein
MAIAGKTLARRIESEIKKGFYHFPLFHMKTSTILFVSALKYLRLPIMVHNLYCHCSDTREVESGVYSRPKERQNSSITEKNMETIQNMRKRKTFIPAQVTHKKTLRRCGREEREITSFWRENTSQKLSRTQHQRTRLPRNIHHSSTQRFVSKRVQGRYRRLNVHLHEAASSESIYLETPEVV